MSAAGYTIKPVSYPRHEAGLTELTCSSCERPFVVTGATPGDLEDPVCRSCRNLDEKKESRQWRS